MASMLEEMRRMAGLESRWPEYTLGEDKLTPLEQHILKKLKTKPTSADDLAWDAPGESLPKDIDKALAHLKKLGKVQAVKQDDEWTWKLLEARYSDLMGWEPDVSGGRGNLSDPPEYPGDRYSANEGPLEKVHLINREKGRGKIDLEFWYRSDMEFKDAGYEADPEQDDAKDLDKALEAVGKVIRLTPQNKAEIEAWWNKQVVQGPEESITIYATGKRYSSVDCEGR